MSCQPFVSVIIPTFNRAQQVQAALRSVLGQTYPEFEAIVVDDGSSDGTEEAVRYLINEANRSRRQARYLFQRNQGPSAARNKGISEAHGDWVAFLDSDDTWLPEKLEWQVRAIDQFKDKCAACITDARLIDSFGKDNTAFFENGKNYEATLGIEPDAVGNLLKTREPFWLSNLLVRADVAKQIGWFDPCLNYAEDHDFLFRLALVTSFCYVNRALSVIDQTRSPENSTCRPWDSIEVRLRGSQLMLEKWLRLDSLGPELRKIVVQSLRQTHSAWTNWYLENGQYEEARRAASEAIKCEMTTKLAIKWTLTRVAPDLARRISHKMRV